MPPVVPAMPTINVSSSTAAAATAAPLRLTNFRKR